MTFKKKENFKRKGKLSLCSDNENACDKIITGLKTITWKELVANMNNKTELYSWYLTSGEAHTFPLKLTPEKWLF